MEKGVERVARAHARIVQALAMFVRRGTAQLVPQANEKSAWGFTIGNE